MAQKPKTTLLFGTEEVHTSNTSGSGDVPPMQWEAQWINIEEVSYKCNDNSVERLTTRSVIRAP